MTQNLNQVLIITIIMYLLIIFILNMLKPKPLYYQKNGEKKLIQFGNGKNKQVVCMQTICLVLPMILYFVLFILI